MNHVVWAKACLLASVALLVPAGCGRLGYESIAANEQGTDDILADVAAPPADAIDTTDTTPGNGAGSLIALPYFLAFEEPSSAWPKLIQDGTGAGVYDTQHVHSGTGAFKVSKRNAGYSGAYLEVTLAAPLTTGSIYARVFIFVPASQRFEDWFISMEMKGTPSHDDKFSFDIVNEGYGFNLSPLGPLLGAEMFPRSQWVCIELGLDLSPTQGRARLWVNNSVAVERSGVSTMLKDSDPGVQRFRLGLLAGPKQKDTTIWLDDWRVATTPIGCD